MKGWFSAPGRAVTLALFVLLAWALAPWCALALRPSPAAVYADAAVPMEDTAPPQAHTPTQQGPKLIALTFDDGPRRATTTVLLDGLAQRGVPATFFLIGLQLEYNEDLITRMDREGHQIGLHTHDHVLLTGLCRADFDAQVAAERTALTQILGHNGFLLRPPYGAVDAATKVNAQCPIVLWSIDPEDWHNRDVARVVNHVVQQAQDGSIILLHDIFYESVEAAFQIIDQLHAQGYLFVTIEQLFAERHIPLEAGEVYYHAYP